MQKSVIVVPHGFVVEIVHLEEGGHVFHVFRCQFDGPLGSRCAHLAVHPGGFRFAEDGSFRTGPGRVDDQSPQAEGGLVPKQRADTRKHVIGDRVQAEFMTLDGDRRHHGVGEQS